MARGRKFEGAGIVMAWIYLVGVVPLYALTRNFYGESMFGYVWLDILWTGVCWSAGTVTFMLERFQRAKMRTVNFRSVFITMAVVYTGIALYFDGFDTVLYGFGGILYLLLLLLEET